MSATPSYLSDVERIKKEIKHTFDWHIRDFNCSTSKPLSKCIQKLEIAFSSGFNFVVLLSVFGDTCESRQLDMQVKCTSHDEWQVRGKLHYGHKCVEWQNFSHLHLCNAVDLFDDAEGCQLLLQEQNIITCEIFHEVYLATVDSVVPVIASGFVQDMIEMFATKKFADVQFYVADEEIQAHANILSSRSPVFDAMFEEKMTQVQPYRFVIKDVDPEVFHELLRYIYVGFVCNFKEVGLKLLATTEKYNVTGLREFCAQELAKIIGIENVSQIFIAADKHGADELKTFAKEFINANHKDVSDTKGWKKLLANHSHLLSDLKKR